MHKTFEFPDLPKGMGSALGAFVRTSWMLLYERMTIIGFNLNDLNTFDCIGDTTTPVTDITLKLATLIYRVDLSALTESPTVRMCVVDDMPIYEVTLFKQTDKLTTAALQPYITADHDEVLIETMYPAEFTLKLYLKPTVSYITEEVNKSYLNESTFACDHAIALASNNRAACKVYFTLDDFEVTENLNLEFEGSESEYAEFIKVIQSLGLRFLSKIA